ncbi:MULTISPECIES: acyl-CoA dehydrogenase family protein [unclassified Sporosarcina]|uniref:acyl-CoA dehydrogenase family protein n=1 Tax=unclassified Sporosarcina TaxID=2647733 RepID=UPI000C16C91C|nr:MULTISPECIES: acyl-CoA dehydrogenase family protein [unclassified Sporosarcina]PIC97910.1 acyl-CoA dehydrogenase [Sporosarcina sp. P29]PID03859.1 acyl-CoA dehydrogenase [Sporosarcina sp. P30]PID07871.1 acyl-CoA dehydrogenase [Sporosarcina sp. P31]PID10667.1 acyl-CoA dehydrogenase [Sporosarcina sp. P32b]
MIYEPYFTEEHEQLRKVIRNFVEKEVKPFVEEWEEAGEFPIEIIKRMGDLGFLGLRYPKELGGQGGDYFTSIVFAEELAKCGCGGFPMAVAVQTDMAIPPIAEFGNDDQKKRFFIPAVKGDKLAAIGISEPNHGSDVASIETRGRKQGNEWIINGTKMYITNGSRADFVTLVTRTSDEPGYKGLSLILVDLDSPGVSISKRLDKVGMRSSDTAEIIFDNVSVPKANLLGEEGKGFSYIMWELQGERLISAAASIGLAESAYDLAYEYAKTRKQFNHPIANFQVISHLLAEMKTEIEVCKELTYATAYRFSNGEVPSKEISMTKLAAAQMAHWVADRALQIFGGNGYMADYPIERIWRDSRLNRIGAGADEVMKEIISKQMGL